MLMFPSMITEMCRRVKVEEYLGDNWISPNTPIYPLKIRGKVTLGKSKKRKVKSEKSMEDNIDSYRPSSVGPFK